MHQFFSGKLVHCLTHWSVSRVTNFKCADSETSDIRLTYCALYWRSRLTHSKEPQATVIGIDRVGNEEVGRAYTSMGDSCTGTPLAPPHQMPHCCKSAPFTSVSATLRHDMFRDRRCFTSSLSRKTFLIGKLSCLCSCETLAVEPRKTCAAMPKQIIDIRDFLQKVLTGSR